MVPRYECDILYNSITNGFFYYPFFLDLVEVADFYSQGMSVIYYTNSEVRYTIIILLKLGVPLSVL